MTDKLNIPPIPKHISPELSRFLRDWLAWAEAGAPGDNPHDFCGVAGLCSNCRWYCADGMLNPPWQELEALFESGFPFGGYDEYYSGGPHHTNPQRLAWVRAALAAGSEED